MNRWTKRALWGLIVVGAVAAVGAAYRETPVLVDAAEVRRGPLRVTLDDDGVTRVRERFTLNSPTDGRLLRLTVEEGDPVRAGETLLAEFQPRPPLPLDARTRAEVEARIGIARAALEQAEARLEQARGQDEFARTNLDRRRKLFEEGTLPEHELDLARRDATTAAEALAQEEARRQGAVHELELAEAGLIGGLQFDDDLADHIHLRATVDGVVLRVFEESERVLPAGAPVLEIGDTDDLEVAADYLSQDAVRVRPGMRVLLVGWGGDEREGGPGELEGLVERVEPSGFTRVSALGVEEQRVLVIVRPRDPEQGWAELRDGYRVELRIVVWEADDVLQVPTGALFREGDAWAVFVVEGGRARARTVELGQRSGLEAEVRSGLRAGESVVLYPSELVDDGRRVEVR